MEEMKNSSANSEVPNKAIVQTGPEPVESTLEIRRRELEQSRQEYEAATKLVQAKKQKANELWEIYGEYESSLDRLVYQRDYLNQELREKRKEIRLLERDLQSAKTELDRLEEITNGVRRGVNRARRKARAASSDHELMKAELSDVEQLQEMALRKLKSAETAFELAGGKLPRQGVLGGKSNPWISGSFYLFAAVVVITLLAVVSKNVPIYTLAIVFIGGLLILAIIGAFQLRNDEGLSEENFLRLMIEVFKRMPLLKGDASSGIAETKVPVEGESETVEGE